MSPRTILAIALLIGLWLLPSAGVYAQESDAPSTSFSQEGHGGEAVDTSQGRTLRDLIDNTVCDWVGGREFATRFSYFPRVLESIRRTHWVLARFYEQELDRLNFCIVRGRLRQVSTEDLGSVTVWTPPGQRTQAAIRIGGRVYWSLSAIGTQSPRSQAYTLIHELTHGFMSDGPNRNNYLRSFVHTLARNEIAPFTPERFQRNLDMNEIGGIPSLDVANTVRRNWLVALDPRASDRDRWAAFQWFSSDVNIGMALELELEMDEHLSNARRAYIAHFVDVFRTLGPDQAEQVISLSGGNINQVSLSGQPIYPLSERRIYPSEQLIFPLIEAARGGNLAVLRYLLVQPGIDLAQHETVDGVEKSALLIAAENNHPEAVQLLLYRWPVSRSTDALWGAVTYDACDVTRAVVAPLLPRFNRETQHELFSRGAYFGSVCSLQALWATGQFIAADLDSALRAAVAGGRAATIRWLGSLVGDHGLHPNAFLRESVLWSWPQLGGSYNMGNYTPRWQVSVIHEDWCDQSGGFLDSILVHTNVVFDSKYPAASVVSDIDCHGRLRDSFYTHFSEPHYFYPSTALMVAAWNGDADVVRAVLSIPGVRTDLVMQDVPDREIRGARRSPDSDDMSLTAEQIAMRRGYLAVARLIREWRAP